MYSIHLGRYHWFRYDEVAYVSAARGFFDGVLINSEHPPVGKYIIALGIRLFGDNPDGWRIFSVVAGVTGVIFVYLLAKRMFGGYIVPVLAATFLSLETYWFASGRLAMLDTFLATAILVSLYCIWRYIEAGRAAWAVGAAAMIGCTAAIKWTGGGLLVLLWGAALIKRNHWVRMMGFSTVVAVACYCLLFMPLYLLIPGLPNLLTLHRDMAEFHSAFRSGADWFNGGIIQWFQSFPIQSGAAYDNPVTWQRVYQVVYSGNIIILWAGLGVLIASAVRLIRKREAGLVFIVSSLFVVAVPWIIIPGTWNVFLPLVPLIALALAYWCWHLWSEHGMTGKLSVGLFVVLSLGWYLALLPRLWPLLYQHSFIDTLII